MVCSNIKSSLLIFIIFLGITIPGLAQDNDRPKIGLVLSGGGAKGLAHIGVLKAMEEAGLYPDYITGTSMGSIIGGLYAMGYTADEIKEIGLAINWDLILSNSVSLNKVTIEEKEFYGRYISEFPIRNGKIGLPQGVIDGQELTLLLNRLTRPAHGINDFSMLPIPYECMGADVVNGESVILKEGSLSQALRASMAIPTIFTPVTIDGKLLVDGGLLRNFPVQEVRDMGADIVIGVSVSSGLQPKEELNSMVTVLAQSAFVASAKDTEEQTKLVDIYIEPDMSNYSTASFWSGPGIIAEGEKSGQSFLPVFKALADSLNRFGPVRVPIRLTRTENYSFDRIEIEGNEIVSDELIKGKLQIKPNQSITIDELESRLNTLYGTLYFSKVFYTIDKTNNTLIIQVNEAPPGALKFAVHFDTDNKAGININLTLRNLVLPSSRFIAEVDLAENPMTSLDYFKYIGKKQNFAVLLQGDWIQSELPGYLIEEAGNVTSSKNLSNVIQANLIRPSLGIQGSYKTNSTIGLAIEYIDHKVTPKVMDSLDFIGTNVYFDRIVNKDWAAKFYYKTNTFNKPYFATKGFLVNIKFNYVFSRDAEAILKSNAIGDLILDSNDDPLLLSTFDFSLAVPLMEKLILKPGFGMTMGNGSSSNVGDILYRSFIGGVRPYGLLVKSYEATPAKRFDLLNYSFISLALQWEVIKNLYFTARTDYLESEYPMVWIDRAVETENIGGYPRRLGFSGKLSYNSLVGPIEFGIGKDQYLEDVNFFFGFGYYIKDR